MRLEINDDDFRALPKQTFRAAAYFLLHAIGDMDEAGVVPTGTSATPPPPPVASVATMATAVPAVAVSAAVSSTTTSPTVTAPVPASNMTPPPPPPPPPPNESGDAGDEDDETGESNVVQGNFPQAGSTVPPPPTSNGTGANTAEVPSPPTTPPVTNAEGAPAVVSAEYDSAGMPWDARIHQKAKGKKKDLTWKLIKGIDAAVVQSVTAELAARKSPSAGSLPQSGNTVPVPPVSNVPAAPGVPAPPAGASSTVPVPPSPAVGSMGGSSYRALIDKITDLTRAAKITPAKVSEICQSHGAPSLMALNGMQHLIADVERSVDAAALGLL